MLHKLMRYLWRFRSRTIRFAWLWLPSIGAGLAVLEQNLGLLRDHLGPWQYVVLSVIVAAVMHRLRAVTTTPLGSYKGGGDAPR